MARVLRYLLTLALLTLSGCASTTRQEPPNKPVSGGRVTIGWEDASSNELGFKIERKDGDQGSFQVIATVGANMTRYTDTGLTRGKIYYYRVCAYNSRGRSDYTELLRVKIEMESLR